jgi:methylthioribose-1-phosphate isomerase
MEGSSVFMIEQNLLPFEFRIFESGDYLETCRAIRTMIVRGAGAIGAVAGFAMAQACLEAPAGMEESFLSCFMLSKGFMLPRKCRQNMQ